MGRTIWAIRNPLISLALCVFVAAVGCRQPPKHLAVPAAAWSGDHQPSAFIGRNTAPIALVQHEESTEKWEDGRAKFSGQAGPLEVIFPADIAPLPAPPNVEAGRPAEYFVGMAIEGHPRVRAALAQVEAAANKVPQARSLEDPVLFNNFYPISDQALQTATGRAGNTLSIVQKYPWPKKRWTKAAIADRETQIAVAKLEQVKLEIEEMVRLAYYELWFADRAITITEDNRQIAAELVNLAEMRYGAGGRQQDVLRAQLQLDALDERLIGLRKQKAQSQADLAALIQQPAMVGIEPTADLPVERIHEQLDALFAAAEECSPRLSARKWAVSRDREKRQLACLGQYPDFTLGAGWQSITEADAALPFANGRDNVSFLVGVTLPICRDRINASIREASAEVNASARELNDALDDSYRQIRRLSEQVHAADEQLRLYNERVLPRAKRALQLSSADYRGKLVDFGEVADGFTDVLMFELQVARVTATLAGAMAQLDRVVGCEVMREG